MNRVMAGAGAALLLTTGAVLFWQGQANGRSGLPAAADSAPAPKRADGSKMFAMISPELPEAPEATTKTREEKRFSRADKDKDGKVTEAELLMPRRKAFAKLDTNHDGSLSFDEWAVKTISKFEGADEDHSGWLSAAEYAETAPKHRAHPARCSC